MAENEKSGSKTSDLMAYKKKRKQKSLIMKLIAILAIFVFVIVIAANFSKIVEPLRGIASKIETKTTDEVGFPIKLSGSASYSFDSFGDNFSLLTDTYLYTYNMEGGQNFAFRHGYSNPIQCTNSKRVLLYDKDYNGFSLFNKTRQLYSQKLEEKIVFASLGGNDAAAIVTNSDRYSNIIYIYNGQGEWKYTRKYIDENVMNVQFSSDERYIYVCVMGVENGEIYTAVNKYDTTAETEAIWSYKLQRPSIPIKMYVKNGRVCLLYNDCGISLSEPDGSVIGQKEFLGTVQCCDFGGDNLGLIYLDFSNNKNILNIMNSEMTVITSKTVSPNINRIISDGSRIYIVESGELCGYDINGEKAVEKQLSDEYSSFVKIGNSVLLLSYNSVDLEEIS